MHVDIPPLKDIESFIQWQAPTERASGLVEVYSGTETFSPSIDRFSLLVVFWAPGLTMP